MEGERNGHYGRGKIVMNEALLAWAWFLLWWVWQKEVVMQVVAIGEGIVWNTGSCGKTVLYCQGRRVPFRLVYGYNNN